MRTEFAKICARSACETVGDAVVVASFKTFDDSGADIGGGIGKSFLSTSVRLGVARDAKCDVMELSLSLSVSATEVIPNEGETFPNEMR